MQNYTNIVLSSKGGVGKTYVASYLYEYLKEGKGIDNIKLINTDTANVDLAKTKWYQAFPIDLKDQNGSIELRNLSNVTKTFANQNLVVDVGANSFYAWTTYLSKFNGIDELQIYGNKVILHVVLVGGQNFGETFNCLKTILNLNLDCKIIVYLNDGFATSQVDMLPSILELQKSLNFVPLLPKIEAFVKMPDCVQIERDTINAFKIQHLALSEVANWENSDISPYLKFTDNDQTTALLWKMRAVRYRAKVFSAYSALDYLFNKKKKD